MHGDVIETTVDSLPAQYYVNHYLKNERKSLKFDNQIDVLYKKFPQFELDTNSLQKIAAETSNDFAALFFAERLVAKPENLALKTEFDYLLSLPSKELYRMPEWAKDYLVLMVPGWNYKTNGQVTGSDLKMPIRLITELGIENYLVPVPANRGVFESVEVLAHSIRQQSFKDKKIIIVGASSAAPAIHETLGRKMSKSELKSVVGWINLGGIVKGSPLIDYFMNWPQKLVFKVVSFFRGWDETEIRSMSYAERSKMVDSLNLPESIIVLNYIGLSLTGDLSHLSRYKYPFIANKGPNDGLTPIADIIVPRSRSLVAVKSDHYFGDDDQIEDKTVAILKLIVDLVQAREEANNNSVH